MSATRHRTAPLALAAALVFAPAAAPAQDFTLEQVMSAPFPSGIVAAPGGSAVAWVQNAEGRRNIWVATAPDFRGRRITDFAEDKGFELGGLRFAPFTPGTDAILFQRGGGTNRAGEFANPTSDPDGPVSGIWMVPADGSAEPRKITDGSSFAVSSRGVVAFSRDGAIWTFALGAAEPEPEKLAEVRGGPGSFRWSPDGSKLAFVSRRGDHSFIGLYDFAAETVRYLDPGIDHDSDPVWSPDGREIAFIRVPNDKDQLPFMPQRTALPWSIRIVDVASGVGREVWRAEEGPGSAFYDTYAENQLFWASGDRLIFPWERDGWLHLYSVSADGGRARLLTPGEFEVQHVVLTPDRRELIYSSNQGDIDRKHLWRVPVDGGTPEPVTSGTGIEWEPAVIEGGDAVAFLASGPTTPAHAAIVTADGARRMLAPASFPEDFPSDELVVPQQVIFPATDGLPIHGQLFLPSDLEPGERRPALLFLHGGSRRQMMLGFHLRGYYHNAYAMNQYMASRGYIVLAINYRSGIGYGMEFREALNYGATGASEVQDVLGAGIYLRSRPDVDPERIGLWGGSYGGFLTAHGLAQASDLFAAGVDLHGVHNWNVGINNFVPSYEPEGRPDFAERAFQSSPMAHLDTWRSPVLLIHGDDDRNVKFSETVDLAQELRERGVDVEVLVFPDEVHGFLLHRNWLAAYRATADFFDRKLRGMTTARTEGVR